MKRMTKIGLAFSAAVALVTGLAISSLAWGPVSDRATFTMEKPATYVTFNSIKNNNTEGDERYFVTAQAEPIAAGKWRDTTVVEDGKYYVVKIYVHNNAASNYKLVAKNVTANTKLEKQADGTWKATGMITSSNAKPKSVWDETTFKTANGEDFTLSFISGSAKYTNADKNDKVRTFILSNDILGGKGVLLGYDKMDGNIPGCFEYSGVITYRVKATVNAKKKTCEDYGYKSKAEGNYTEKKEIKTDDGQTLICYVPVEKKKTCEDYGYKSKAEGNYTEKKEIKTDDGQTLICYVPVEKKKTCEDYGYKSKAEGNYTEKKEIKTDDGQTLICYVPVEKKKTCEDYGYKSKAEGNYTEKKEIKTDDGQTLICYVPVEKKKTCEDYGYKSKAEGNYTEKKEIKTDDGQTLICYVPVEKKKTCEDYGYKSEAEGNYTEKKEVTINGETVVCYAEKTVVPPTEETPTQPVVNNPTSLPKSGPTEVISSVVGLSSLAMATAYYVSSRKRLQ